MISGYGCYLKYLGIRSHFVNQKYDYIKYNGAVRAKETTFNTRKDRFYFDKIAKKLQTEEEVEKFFISNFISGNKNYTWIGELVSEENFEILKRWKSTFESMGYILGQDIDKIFSYCIDKKFSDAFVCKNGNYPLVYKLLKNKEITLESLIIMNMLIHDFLTQWKLDIKDSIVFPDYYQRIIKYSQFVRFYITNEQLKNFKKIISKKIIDNSS